MATPIRDEDPRWKLKTIWETYRHTAELLIKKKKEWDAAKEPAKRELLADATDKTGVEFKKWAELLYTYILSYNQFKAEGQFPGITDADILKAQLVQDEVSAMLKEEGFNIEYGRKS
jgi:hypothetical protein